VDGEQLALGRGFEPLYEFFHFHPPIMAKYSHQRKPYVAISLHFPTNGSGAHPTDVDARDIAAQKLRALREAAGLSKLELSNKARVSRNTITNAELNRNDVSIGTLEALARAFGLEAWEVLKPGQPTAQKAVPRTPGPMAARKPTGVAAELSRSLTEVSRSYRGATAKAPNDMSIRSISTDRDSPRPKSRQKVAQTVKARTKP